MLKKLLSTFIVLLICSGLAYSQMELRVIPKHLKPYEALTDFEKHRMDNLYNVFDPPPPPKNVDEMHEAPARILNQEGGFEIVNMVNGPNGQAETWIALDPNNPSNVIGTANDGRYLTAPSQGGYRMAAYYSKDGGKTFQTSLTPLNQDVYIPLTDNPWEMTIFDPGIAFDNLGWAYYSYGFTETREPTENQNGVFVCRTSDGGETWDGPYYVVIELGGGKKPFHDRYMIAADNIPGSPYENNLYITWKQFYFNQSILFSFSSNQGQNWSIPKSLPGSNNSPSQTGTPIVGPNGEVYVTWESASNNYTTCRFQKSTDGGQTWLPNAMEPMLVETIGEPLGNRQVLADKANMRIGSDPFLAVDISDGPRRGWIYIVMAGVDENDKTRLFITHSEDGGETWTEKQRIDENPLGNDIFLPSITVDRVTGDVSIFYYSSQNDPDNHGVDGYLAYSEDGVNFRNIRITPETWYVDGPEDVSDQGSQFKDNFYWGDYTGITAHNGNIYPCFWMPSGPFGNFYTLDVYTALLSTKPKAPQNLSIENSYENPATATLTWSDPLENMLGGSLSDFEIVIFRNGAEIGTVEPGIQQYVDDELTDGERYNYDLRARNDKGLSIAVSDFIYAGGAPEPLAPNNIFPRPNENGVLLSWKNPEEHVDGSFAHDLSRINIYVDDELYTTYDDNIQAGSDNTLLLELETENFYKIKLQAVGSRLGNETPSLFSREYLAYAGSPYLQLSENFDDSENMVPIYVDSLWAVTSELFQTEPNCITDSPGEDMDLGSNEFTLPPFVVDPDSTVFSFDHIAAIDEAESDYGEIIISRDFGNTWRRLYYIGENSDPNAGSDDPADFEWMGVHRNLAPYATDTVMVRFIAVANLFRNEAGWFVDNIRVDNDPNVSVDEQYTDENIKLNIYPNPVAEESVLKLTLSSPGTTLIEIYDGLGNRIETIANTITEAGVHEFRLNAAEYSSGAYYCRVSHNGASRTFPVMINK